MAYSTSVKADKIKSSRDKSLIVPDNPAIPFIKGDGIGKEVIPSAIYVINKAVEKAYGKKRKIHWFEIYAGESALEKTGELLPNETVETIKEHLVCLKGPIITPEGRKKSLNVELRQKLNLYTSIRPVIWYGQGSPVRSPELIDYMIFRENTDDIYLGIEFEKDTNEALKVLSFLRNDIGVPRSDLPSDCALALKPTSEEKSKRHIRKTFREAMSYNRRIITVVHRGNMLKKTEGMFVKWAYEVAKEEEFKNLIISEEELNTYFSGDFGRARSEGFKLLLKDRLITSVLGHLISRIEEYDVILAQNLNGDYFTHGAASLIGGVQFIPVANIGEEIAIFETLHGVAKSIAGKGIANPTGAILAGKMLLEHIGWCEAAEIIVKALKQTYADWVGTYDVIREWSSAAIPGKKVDTQGFVENVIKNMQ